MRTDFGSRAVNAWGKAFLRRLGEELPTGDDPRPLLIRVRDEAHRLFRERATDFPHPKTRLIIALGALILAGYRQILAATGDEAVAFETVRRAFRRTHAGPATFVVRWWLRLTREPARALAKLSLAKFSESMYGPTMGFAQEARADGVDLIVTRCAYHGFFADHGEPHLTTIFCGWDRNWMDVVNESGRPIRVERPTTISTGGECCRFRFVRDEERAPGPGVDVILDLPPAPRGAAL